MARETREIINITVETVRFHVVRRKRRKRVDCDVTYSYRESDPRSFQSFCGRPPGLRSHWKSRIKHWKIPYWSVRDNEIRYIFDHPREGSIELTDFVGFGKDNALGLVRCGKFWDQIISHIEWFEGLKRSKQITSERLVKELKR